MFSIVNVSRHDSQTVKVLVEIDARAWHDYAKRGVLGVLYGVDISNRVYQEYGVQAYNPSVDDNSKPKGRTKRLTLYYADASWKPAPLAEVIYIDFKARRRMPSGDVA